MTVEGLAILASGAAIVAVAASLVLARNRIEKLRTLRMPFGWKFIEDQGPPLGMAVSAVDAAELQLTNPGRSMVLYVFGCSQCSILSTGVPALLEDLPDLTVTILSIDGSGPDPIRHPRVAAVRSPRLVKQMNFSVAPFVVFFEDGVPLRKGIVNTLEQLRLTVDPSQVHLDIQLR